MKRTTYILIGLFVAGLCLLVGGIFLMYFTGKPYFNDSLNLQGKQIVRELPSCRIVWFAQTKMEKDDCKIWLANSVLEVSPSQGEKNAFSCSEKMNDYLKMTVMGDTVKIVLDYPVDEYPPELKKSKYALLYSGDMKLNISQDVESVIHDIDSQELKFKNLAKDSLSIDTSNSIVVDSCNFAALHVVRSGGMEEVQFQSGVIDNLHLDLDWMGNWSVDVQKCRINTEYLRGHNENVLLQKGECKRMFWIPVKEDSKLQVTLMEEACVVMKE